MQNTEFAEKLATAVGDRHLRTYVWKGKKERTDDGKTTQETVNLMDATEEQLDFPTLYGSSKNG